MMTHIVIHEDAGGPQCRLFEDVNAAAGYIEQLVNLHGVDTAQLFALQPVEFTVRSFVKVEVANAAPAPVAAPPSIPVSQADQVVSAAPTPIMAPEPAPVAEEVVTADPAEGIFADAHREPVQEVPAGPKPLVQRRPRQAPAMDAEVAYVDASMPSGSEIVPPEQAADYQEQPPPNAPRRGLFGR